MHFLLSFPIFKTAHADTKKWQGNSLKTDLDPVVSRLVE